MPAPFKEMSASWSKSATHREILILELYVHFYENKLQP